MKDRLPDWDERSNIIQEECDNEAALKAARDEIFGDLVASVSYLKQVRNDPLQETKERLKAAIEHCKLAGLYVEQVKHSGQVKITELELDV